MTNSLKLVDGHYIYWLAPLGKKDIHTQNNRIIAEQRALNPKKRLKKDVLFHVKYSDFMKDLGSKTCAVRVPAEDVRRRDGQAWYIHHTMIFTVLGKGNSADKMDEQQSKCAGKNPRGTRSKKSEGFRFRSRSTSCRESVGRTMVRSIRCLHI